MKGAAISTHASLRLSAHIWPWALNIEFHAVTHVAKPFIPSFTCVEIVYKLGHASSVPSHWNTFHTDWITLFPLSHYSDTHSLLSAGSQSCLRYQYWKAGGRRGTERGTFISLVLKSIFYARLRVLVTFLCLISGCVACQCDVMISCCGQLLCCHRLRHFFFFFLTLWFSQLFQ